MLTHVLFVSFVNSLVHPIPAEPFQMLRAPTRCRINVKVIDSLSLACSKHNDKFWPCQWYDAWVRSVSHERSRFWSLLHVHERHQRDQPHRFISTRGTLKASKEWIVTLCHVATRVVSAWCIWSVLDPFQLSFESPAYTESLHSLWCALCWSLAFPHMVRSVCICGFPAFCAKTAAPWR